MKGEGDQSLLLASISKELRAEAGVAPPSHIEIDRNQVEKGSSSGVDFEGDEAGIIASKSEGRKRRGCPSAWR